MRTVALLVFLLFLGIRDVPALELTAEEHAWLKEHGDSLVLAYDAKFPPLEFQNTHGQFDGLSSDVLAAVEQRLGVTFHKKASVWTDVLNGLQTGRNALTPSVSDAPERRPYMLFTRPYFKVPLVIITSTRHDTVRGPQDLKGLRVAVVRGYASAHLVTRMSQGNFTIVEVDNIPEGLRDVSFGVADAFVESLAVAAYYIDREKLPNLRVAGDLGVTQELSIGVSKHYPLLAGALGKALADIPPEELQAMTERWLKFDQSALRPRALRILQGIAALALCAVLTLGIRAMLLGRELKQKLVDLEAAKATLHDHLSHMHLVLDVTNAGFWERYPLENREEHSPEWFTMLGYAPQEHRNSVSCWLNLLHPEDRQKTTAIFDSYLQNGGRGLYEAEFRMRAEDGSWRWVLGKGKTVAWAEDGHPSRVLGLNIDIHRLKMAQQDALRLQVLTETLLDQATHFIGLVDLEGTITLVNNAFLSWARTDRAHVLGQSFWIGPWWPDPSQAQREMRDVLHDVGNGKTVRREITLINPHGETGIFDFTASPFRDEHGHLSSCLIEGRDITELKNSQTAIMESERRFRTIFESAPYAITINRLEDGQYVDVNDAFLEKTNMRRKNVLGQSMETVGRFPTDHIHHVYRMLANKQAVHNVETTFERADGSIGHFLYSGDTITLDGAPCVLSIVIDITELKAAQDALRRSQDLFSRLFHLSPDMIVLTRQADGEILEVNDAFTRFTGYARDDAVGRTVRELGLFAVPGQGHALAGKILRQRHIENTEFELLRRDGHIVSCATSARLLDVDGAACILSITRDVSQTKAMQEAMVQSEKMLSLGGIAAGIAHEINNPLGIILQAIQTIRLRLRPDLPKNQEEARRLQVDLDNLDHYLRERKISSFFSDIETAGMRAANIIRHMLDFSRRSESRRCRCHIPNIIEQAIELAANDYDLKKNYDFKTITLLRDYADDLPSVSCTETELEQVILNLLRNAAQAMASVHPPLQEPTIRIRVRFVPDAVTVTVEDNGPGISPEHRKRIFEPFFTTKAPGTGTGLGLSVSYFIITKGHGGRMSVAPSPNGGTIFRLELPVSDKNGACP